MKLPKVYEPGQYESDIYALWEQSGVFKPSNRGEPYTIVMPPPNANANLHIGYELVAALEDIATRYQRGQGKAALLLPGADHAGFETQSVYEKHLAKEGKSRFDFSREQLYSQIWDFVALNRGNFEAQMRQMGVGCDWSRFTFTLDEKIVNRAYATFKKMWDEKLIYRGERLVNYCTFHRTGFADIEVEYKEAKTPLYYMKYGPFELATTRPETKFGDTAVAVHPDDQRYKEYVGKVVTVEGVNGPFEVQVIADEMVDPNFGTGVVKITPAHSFDDWEVAQRHNLPAKRIINHDGTLNHHAGRFEGMSVLEAREAVAKALEEKGLLLKVDRGYTNRIGVCYKCGTTIEPMLMEQWFLNVETLAKPAIEALKANKIKFYPASKKDQLVRYLEGLHDWNLSRQIAWGIPIPAFQNVDDSDDWIYDERVDQEIIEVDGKTYHRDPDVFDTWFSSSSWPYATLDYPDSDDFKRFYPLSLMETGGEILYPWVSRMIMLGLYVTGEAPFREVYIHGYVMAEDGSKMSKSIGNVVDPLPVIEKYGSDALRMGIISGRAPAVNRGYDSRRVEEARNFCNKLWNVARYIESVIGDKPDRAGAKPSSAADHWILDKMRTSQEKICRELDRYGFSEAYDTLYHFVWDDLADWYIEASKAEPNKPLLAYLLEQVLLLAHPFAPFLTETIWQTLAWEDDSILAGKQLADVLGADKQQVKDFSEVQAIVAEARYIVRAVKVADATLYYTDVPFLRDNAATIKRLAGLKAVSEVQDGAGLALTSTKLNCWLDIDKATAQAYVRELEAQREAQNKLIEQLKSRLANKSYVENAPKAVVEQTKDQLAEAEDKLASVDKEIKRFSA
ncbi:MAG TPA: valine--tRNA ligase [Candidatus Saccharimonadales bacterium]|nr:valine--tRNA ligase [Candidatus Saccharimonadales bacterium]